MTRLFKCSKHVDEGGGIVAGGTSRASLGENKRLGSNILEPRREVHRRAYDLSIAFFKGFRLRPAD